MTLNISDALRWRTISTWTATMVFVAAAAITMVTSPAHAVATAPSLGAADSFAVLGGQSVTNTGPTVITGDVGVSPGTSITGLLPVQVTGAIHQTDAVAAQAQTDLTAAYNNAAGQASDVTLTSPGNLGGLTLAPGVYTAASSINLTGTLTLDALGNPNAVWVFQIGSTLITASDSNVLLVNGASPCNVYWQVGSSATLGTGTDFVGTIMALASVGLDTGAALEGRALAQTAGSVTLDTNVITRPNCAGGTTGGTTTGGVVAGTTTGGLIAGTTTGGTTGGAVAGTTTGGGTGGALGGLLGGVLTTGGTTGGILGGLIAGSTGGTGGSTTGGATGGGEHGGDHGGDHGGGEHGGGEHGGDHGGGEHGGDHGGGEHGGGEHGGDHGGGEHGGGEHGGGEHGGGEHGGGEHGGDCGCDEPVSW
ncbi:ice-binding family protein (plasmid) [Kitasatospora sp. NBC_00070]|uniref:ice-binding family protein n=1 Tax=Kitasatospora sp. NBC_00070 TaxID=2975962 RepID=UPI002F90C709